MLYAALFAVAAAPAVIAQSTNANCTDSSFDWVSALLCRLHRSSSVTTGRSRYSTQGVRVLAKSSRI